MQDLNRLLYFDDGQQQDASDLPELKSQLSLTALGNAIRYLKLVDETSNLGHFQVKQLNMDRFNNLDLSLFSIQQGHFLFYQESFFKNFV